MPNIYKSPFDVVDITTGDIVGVIRFVNQILWVQDNSKLVFSVSETRNVNPLTVKMAAVGVSAIHLQSLVTTVCTIELFSDTFFALVVFKTETGFVSFCSLYSFIVCEVVVSKPSH